MVKLLCMKKMMTNLTKQFFICGLIGWCLEITFTALNSLRRRDLSLKGSTSIWMFPIYGMAAFLYPIFNSVKEKSILFRGCLYAFFIFLTEFVTGRFLTKHNLCPWSYLKSKWHIKGVIRLDYLPCWFFTGLLYEKVLTKLFPFGSAHNENIGNP